MKTGRWVLAAALAVGLLPGCAGGGSVAEPEGRLEVRTLLHDGAERRYALYVPARAGEAPLPLVFSLHGGGVTLEGQTGLSGHKSPFKLWMDLAEREGFYVVYPEGLPGAYGKPTWNDCRADCTVSSSADDVGFLLQILEEVAAEYPVDRSRVYASGMSNGGFMALRLAVEAPDTFAAVAAIGAAMPAVSGCGAPRVAVPVLFMNGTADRHMPYDGGTLSHPPKPSHGTAMSTPDSAALWAGLAGARLDGARRLPDLDPDDGGTVTVSDYVATDRVWVRLYTIGGGGHAAPSLRERYSPLFERYFGHQNHDLEAVEEIWRFFAGVSSGSDPGR